MVAFFYICSQHHVLSVILRYKHLLTDSHISHVCIDHYATQYVTRAFNPINTQHSEKKFLSNYTAPLNQQRLYSHNVIMCCAWCVLLCLQQDAITYTHTFSSKALAMIDICLLITTCCPLSVWLSHSNNSKRIATVVPYRYYSCHTATYVAIPDRIV